MANVKTIDDLQTPGAYTVDRIKDMSVDEVRGTAKDMRNGVSTNKWGAVSRAGIDGTWTNSRS